LLGAFSGKERAPTKLAINCLTSYRAPVDQSPAVRRRKRSASRPAPGSSMRAVDVLSGTPEETAVASIARDAAVRPVLAVQVV